MYKRFEIRKKTVVPIEVITNFWDEPISLLSDDLSPRGTYLVSELMPQLGEHIVCSFDLLRGDPSYCLFGEVSRINWHRRRTDTGRPGFGVRFLDIRPMERLKMRDALRELPPSLPAKMRDGVSITKIITV
jgi:hypothetical protein